MKILRASKGQRTSGGLVGTALVHSGSEVDNRVNVWVTATGDPEEELRFFERCKSRRRRHVHVGDSGLQALIDADSRHQRGDYDDDERLMVRADERLREMDPSLHSSRNRSGAVILQGLSSDHETAQSVVRLLAAAYPQLEFDVDIFSDLCDQVFSRYRRGLKQGNSVSIDCAFDHGEGVALTVRAESTAALNQFIDAAKRVIALREVPDCHGAGECRLRFTGEADFDAVRVLAESHPAVYLRAGSAQS